MIRKMLQGLAVTTLLFTAHTAAQPDTQPAGQPAENTPGDGPSLPDMLQQIQTRVDPRLRAGLRSHLLKEAQIVRSAVVIVPGPIEAAEAIGRWQGITRFPVLIDDGTESAAEDIARFVRAFGPERVLLWEETVEPLTDEPGSAFDRIGSLLAATAGLTGPDATVDNYIARVREQGVAPMGVVAIDPADPAWVAGLALAAGHVQILAQIKTPSNRSVDMAINPEQIAEIEDILRRACSSRGLSWTEIGDEVDAVTLCWNGPTKIGERDAEDKRVERAVGDAIGRRPGDENERWAYSGIIFGSAPRALYQAMCSLFLGGDRAWLFDGYPDDGVWKQFDVTTAAGVLREGGWRPVVTDTPTQSDADWRTRSQAGLDAELIMVNTKGNRDRFQLDPGWVLSRDVPTLDRPAAIHFVHSWSASRPASRSTIAGRFIEHGAYAYAGSVFEPYLSAFVPTPAVAQRLTAGVNFGAAVRAESGKPWRINCFGDPLLTLRRPAEGGRRANADAMPIGDFTEALTAMRKALLNREFGSGFRLAKMLGRDRDTTRLAEALLRDQPDSFGNDVARAAIMPLFREGRYDLVMQAVQRAAPNDLVNTPAGDAVWHAARQLGAGDVQPVFGVLKGMLREPHEVADAIELAGWIRSVQSPADAAAFLRGVGDVTRNDRDRSELADAIRAFGG